MLHKTSTPTDFRGQTLKRIPFFFVGSVNNDPSPDYSPMYDLCDLNIAHYRNSADYEESCFMVGQPTPVVMGITQQWSEQVLKGTMQLGSRGVIPLPVGGDAKLLQAEPNTMPFEAMQHKERQMVAMGAKLVEQRNVQRTYGEAQLEEASESSILAASAKNVSAAYKQALVICSSFVGSDSEVKYELNTDFPASRMGPDELKQLVEMWQQQAITTSEMRDGLRKAGKATLDDEEYAAAIETEPRPGLPALTNPGGNPGNNNPEGGADGS